MNYANYKNANIAPSSIIMGCMRIAELSQSEIDTLVNTAIECGINHFDHSDVYAGGECETVFGKAVNLKSDIRSKLIIQGKCGIANGCYNSSKKHLIKATDAILKRLNTDYLDTLLIHRPDTLVDPCEVAEVFDSLKASGKVRHFGVSNHNPSQIELLKKHVNVPLVANQLQLSIAFSSMIDFGMNVNTGFDGAVSRDGGVLDYSRLNDMTIQAWSPFRYGFFEGIFLDSPKYPELNKKLDELAEKYSVTNMAVASAWILRHPAKMQVISGTNKPERIKAMCAATTFVLTHDEWYDLYKAAGNRLP